MSQVLKYFHYCAFRMKFAGNADTVTQQFNKSHELKTIIVQLQSEASGIKSSMIVYAVSIATDTKMILVHQA